MELPFGTEGRKATHDFLSLYSSASAHAQRDPAPPPGRSPETQDFLQPLERVGKNSKTKERMIAAEQATLQGPHGPGERHLTGGFGTNSISCINQRSIEPARMSLYATTAQASSTIRNDENSTSSSYPGSGFTLWDESAVQKGKTRKENIAIAAERLAQQEAGVTVVGVQWPSSLNKPSSNHIPINATFSSFSSSQHERNRPTTSQKRKSFMDMIISAKNDMDEDEEEEEDDDDFIIKKESSPHPKGNLSVKIEERTIDQKPNTPRSKHSATEQRRRSKINDRFLKLREVIPNSVQKRDKASFLLEVIEYIQFLQEKVNRYEGSYNAWSQDPSKTTNGRNVHLAEGFVSKAAKTECSPALVFPDENKARPSSSIPINGNNLIDSDTSAATRFREKDQQPELASKAMPSHEATMSDTLTLGRTSPTVSSKQVLDMDRKMAWPPSQFQNKRSLAPDCSGKSTNDKELTVESGNVISRLYSQGLLNTLTDALHQSGVDLSQASLSVKIDLGKKSLGNNIPHSSPSPATAEGNDIPASLPPSRTSATIEDFDRTIKKHRTC